jgi:uncharacterized delta-60 repeat protein
MKAQLLVVCLALAITAALAQVDTAWVRRFNGNLDSTDMAAALALGTEGGVYVTGFSFDGDTIEDFATLRYEADGSVGWFRRYDGRGDTSSRAVALAVDEAGICYVTGRTWIAGSKYDWMTVQHDTDGAVRWTTYHSGTLAENDEARAVAIAPGGGCIVTGAAFGPAMNWDFTTIRYGTEGETLWTSYYNGSADGADEAEAVALDTAGDIYVTGSSRSAGTNLDIVTIKYDQTGETLWARRYAGAGGISDEDKASCITIDPMQNVYVGGYTEGYGTGRDFIVIKYSGHGDTLWTRRFNGSADDDDEVVGIGTDDRGRVYVCGYSTGTGTFADYFTICYSPLGESLWAHRWDYGGYGNWATALAVDGDGNSYVTGYGFDPVTQYDFHTISLDPDGAPRWQIRYSGYADDWDQPVDIGLDADRNVYVTGFSMSNAQDFDYVTIKYVQEPGIEETMSDGRGTRTIGPTVIRGVLFLPAPAFTPHSSLFALSGEKVLDLHAGTNDVSRLAPGVYLVSSGQLAADGKASAMTKVVLTR